MDMRTFFCACSGCRLGQENSESFEIALLVRGADTGKGTYKFVHIQW